MMRDMVGVGRHGWSGVWLEGLIISHIYMYIVYIYLSVLQGYVTV